MEPVGGGGGGSGAEPLVGGGGGGGGKPAPPGGGGGGKAPPGGGGRAPDPNGGGGGSVPGELGPGGGGGKLPVETVICCAPLPSDLCFTLLNDLLPSLFFVCENPSGDYKLETHQVGSVLDTVRGKRAEKEALERSPVTHVYCVFMKEIPEEKMGNSTKIRT